MKIKIKTRETLYKDGFLRNKDGLYLGESKSKPDIQISNYQDQFMLGKEYNVYKLDWNSKNEPTFKTTCGSKIPWYMVDGQLPDKSKLRDLTISKIFAKGEIDICTTTGNINFPCKMATLSLKEVKEIYAWILKSSPKFKKNGGDK